MSDTLDAEIEQARQALQQAKDNAAHWAHEMELRAVRLNALEQAAELRPIRGRKNAENGATKKGRKPGAISRQWRQVLLQMAMSHPEGAAEQEIIALTKIVGGMGEIRPKDVEERMRAYMRHGLVFQNVATNKWQVPDVAMPRLRMDTAPPDELENAAEDDPLDIQVDETHPLENSAAMS